MGGCCFQFFGGIVEKDTVEKLTKIIDELGPKLNSFIKSTT